MKCSLGTEELAGIMCALSVHRASSSPAGAAIVLPPPCQLLPMECPIFMIFRICTFFAILKLESLSPHSSMPNLWSVGLPHPCVSHSHCPWRAHSPVVTHIPSATSGLNLASGTPADLLKPEGLPRTIIFLGPDVGKASPGAGSFESLTKSLPTHVLIHGPASGELALCSCPSTTTGDVLPDLDTPVVQLHTSGTHSTHRRCHLNTWHYEQVAFV